MKRTLALLLALVLMAGCSTTSPLVNWDSRIGNYTYDLALMDLGPPIRSSKLQDGSLVVEWLVQEAKAGTTEISSLDDFAPRPFADSPFPDGVPPRPDRYLRLTFGPDRKLTAWQRFQQY